MKKLNKKGAEMTIGTIVIIVLALIVLVVLIVGFTSGWGNLWGRISAFFSGGDNVDSIASACNVACSTNAKYDYCDRVRDLKFKDAQDDTQTKDVTCESLKTNTDTEKKSLGITVTLEPCDITCTPTATQTCKELGGIGDDNGWQASGCDAANGQLNKASDASDASSHENQYCCVTQE